MHLKMRTTVTTANVVWTNVTNILDRLTVFNIGCMPNFSLLVYVEVREKMTSRSSSIIGRPPSKVVFHQRLSSIKGCLPSEVIFHHRSSSIKGCLPSKGVLHQRSSFIKGRLPSKVVFHQRSSSIRGHLLFYCIKCTLRSS